MKQHKLLVIAFHYPPDNASTGVLRTLKFTEYLIEYGWVADVISVDESLYTSIDQNLKSQIPEQTKVFRTWAIDIKKSLSIAGYYPGALEVPDRYWPWILAAYRKGSELIKSGGYSAVYCTYPVASALIAGLFLKRKFNIPLFVDFRDPWVEESIPKFRRMIEGYIEREVIKNADRVICNTPRMRHSFLERYPDLGENKFVTITNGYDEKDFANLNPSPLKKFEILYPGLIDQENRDPEPLLEGIALCIERDWIPSDDIQLTFLGCGPNGHSHKFENDLARFKLNNIVEVTEPRIPYHEALQRLASADVLVVLSEPLGTNKEANSQKSWTSMQVPAKVYEYLRLGRPLLALISGGAVADVLDAVNRGEIITPSNIEKIAETLRSLYLNREISSSLLKEIPDQIKAYDRKNLTFHLAQELNKIASK